MGAFNTNTRPAWVAWLATQPRGIVAAYPDGLGARKTSGTSGLTVTRSTNMLGTSEAQIVSADGVLRLLSADTADPRTADLLTSEHVRYVVVEGEVYVAEGRPVPTLDPRHFTLLRTFGADKVFSVHEAGR